MTKRTLYWDAADSRYVHLTKHGATSSLVDVVKLPRTITTEAAAKRWLKENA